MSYGWPPLEPGEAWVRALFVMTADGAATGADGLSGSINNEADHRVFAILRETCDAVVVGARTAELEGYPPVLPEKRLVKVDRSTGDLAGLLEGLAAEGFQRILFEGGPTLLGAMLDAELIDELCLTVTPRIVAGDGGRIVKGLPRDIPLRLVSVVNDTSTLLLRYVVG